MVAWRIDEDNNKPNKRKDRVFETEIERGQYVFEVPAGSYKLYVVGEGFYKQWYEDADNADDATTVEVDCEGEGAEANFIVTEQPAPTLRKISGMVYDAETEEPIFNALITFYLVEN